MHQLSAYLDNQFFKRWTLANAAGWAAGLLLGGAALAGIVLLTLLTRSSIPFVGLALAGAIVGACVGAAQRRILQLSQPEATRWLRMSAVGGAIGAFPAILASFITGISWLLGFAAVGAIFGVAVGAAQWYILRERAASWHMRGWLAAYALGGLLCGVITMSPPHPLLLPLCCPLGTLIMGAATGTAVLRLLGDGKLR